MTEENIEGFIAVIETKNSWGKNEIIEVFRRWVITTLISEMK